MHTVVGKWERFVECLNDYIWWQDKLGGLCFEKYKLKGIVKANKAPLFLS